MSGYCLISGVYDHRVRTDAFLFGGQSVSCDALAGVTETSSSRVALSAVHVTSWTTQRANSHAID